MFIVSSAAAVEHPEPPKDFQDCKHMFWDCALSGGILWAFSPLFIAAANKDLLNGTAGSVSIIFPISDCWKLPWKKHYCWSGMTERPFFCLSCFSFPHWRQDKAHILAIVSAIMVKRNGKAFTLPRSRVEPSDVIVWATQPGLPGHRRTGPLCFSWAHVLATQKEARATCSSSALISYTNLIMGSSEGVQQKTRQIPAAQRELIARVISRKIFTRGSYSGFYFHFANEGCREWEKSSEKAAFWESIEIVPSPAWSQCCVQGT